MEPLNKAIEIAGTILLVPFYYDAFERNFSVALSPVAIIVGALLFALRPSRALAAAAAAAFLAMFLLYWLALMNVAGIFLWQTAIRAACLIAFGYVMAALYHFFSGKDDSEPSEGDGASSETQRPEEPAD